MARANITVTPQVQENACVPSLLEKSTENSSYLIILPYGFYGDIKFNNSPSFDHKNVNSAEEKLNYSFFYINK